MPINQTQSNSVDLLRNGVSNLVSSAARLPHKRKKKRKEEEVNFCSMTLTRSPARRIHPTGFQHVSIFYPDRSRNCMAYATSWCWMQWCHVNDCLLPPSLSLSARFYVCFPAMLALFVDMLPALVREC